ncbi:hypothetical protein [Variovorax sp. OV700]|uniref:hypothetical protein n=1 Tax=Variovorax sp. OV700 TaxID=1882826 RepID=UPI00088C5524|nr:hypothetical protein [Variovorax sp. OV700]SDI78657.1 hypothetical protein SAMN05444748_107136 [Variovorax sp. OV700]
MKAGLSDSESTFLCDMRIPILVNNDRQRCISIVGVFRSGMPAPNVDEWVLDADGKPRSDRDLAAEVLIEIRKPLRSTSRRLLHTLGVADILQLESAAAIVVSTFLAALPRSSGRYWRKGKVHLDAS